MEYMKATIPSVIEVDITSVKIKFSLRHDYAEDEKPLPKFMRNERCEIEILADGTVVGWDGPDRTLHIKVVDEGYYELIGTACGGSYTNVIENAYVPSFIPNEWGDYLSLDIKGGKVKNWTTFFNTVNLEKYFKDEVFNRI
jgi:hypothetical protein